MTSDTAMENNRIMDLVDILAQLATISQVVFQIHHCQRAQKSVRRKTAISCFDLRRKRHWYFIDGPTNG
ncbi:MAG: hypothetical protein ABL921_23315 [Pirellula sp.]